MQNKDHNNSKGGAGDAKKGGALPLLEFALGAALAGAAGFMYVTHKEDIDREAKKRIDQLAKLYKETKPEIEKRVKQVWGEINKNTIATYLNLRSMLLHELQAENMAKRGKMLQKNYENIVDSVSKSARKSGMLTPAMEKGVGQMFKMDWKSVEKMLTSAVMMGAQKAVSGAQKAMSGMKNLKAAGKAKKVSKHIKAAAKKMGKAKKAVNKKK